MRFRSSLLVLLLLGVCLPSLRRGVAQTIAPKVQVVSSGVPLTPGEIDDLLKQARDLEGNDTALAMQKTRDALAAARASALRPSETLALLQLGRCQRWLNDYSGALKSAEDGMALARTLGDRHLLGELFLLRGFVEWNQAKVPEATVSMMEAFRIGESLHDDSLRVGALYGRGVVRGRVDDLDGALTHLSAALELAEKTRDARLGFVLNSLGVVYLQRKDYPRAKTYFERALACLKDGTNRRTYAYVLLNLGQIAIETGDPEGAGRLLDESAALCEQFGFRRGRADIAYLRGARERRLGHLDEAKRQLDVALALAETLGNPDLFISIYEEYAQTATAQGDYRAALDYTRNLAEKREIVRSEKSRRQTAEIQARYETEHHARQLEVLQSAHDAQQASLAVKDAELGSVRWIVVSLVLGGITLGALASRQRARARLARRLLAETRAAKTIVEIADARKAELLVLSKQNLDESEARFRGAFEYSAFGLALVGLDGRWLRVNQALCKVIGYTEEELLARDFQSITYPSDLDADLVLAKKLAAREIDAYTLEKRYLHKAGHVVWIKLDVTLMLDFVHGQPSYYISQVQDITEQRNARELLRAAKEEAEKANAAKSLFLSRMSHELRTPLNAILGFGQLLENEDLGDAQNQSVAHITGAGKHLLELINEVLDIAQVESDEFIHQRESIFVADALGSAVSLMEPLARDFEVTLTLEVIGTDPLFIQADPRRLRRVLVSLLSNAIKYNRPGGQAWVRGVAQGGRVRLEVSDTGPGIAAADAERVFAPFTRLAATESVPGTGLGLSVAKALTEVMGGVLSLESRPGEGSTFALEFARMSAQEAEREALPVLAGVPPEFLADYPRENVVLYVEDHPDNLELVRQILARMDKMRFVSACTGKAGIEAARKEVPDLILLDLKLPDMTGVEVLRRLRTYPALEDVPVIVMSADASMQHRDVLRSLGVLEYLTNPFDLKVFCLLVERAVLAARKG